MPLNLFYTMVQKSQKWPKTQIKGGSCLLIWSAIRCALGVFCFFPLPLVVHTWCMLWSCRLGHCLAEHNSNDGDLRRHVWHLLRSSRQKNRPSTDASSRCQTTRHLVWWWRTSGLRWRCRVELASRWGFSALFRRIRLCPDVALQRAPSHKA